MKPALAILAAVLLLGGCGGQRYSRFYRQAVGRAETHPDAQAELRQQAVRFLDYLPQGEPADQRDRLRRARHGSTTPGTLDGRLLSQLPVDDL